MTWPKSPAEVAERFWAKVEKTETCWLWTGASQGGGYGRFGRGRFAQTGPRVVLAHRWSYEHLVGPIPAGLTVDHLCRTPACVNPEHLELVTLAENTARARAVAGAGRCAQGHDLTKPENIYLRAAGGRQCRICSQARKARLRKPAA